MVLVVLLMIFGFSGIFIGIMLIAVVPDPSPLVGFLLIVFGAVAGPYSIVALMRYNREFRDKAWQLAIDNPDSIFGRWTDRDGREILFAVNGIFVGKRYWAFLESFSRLNGVEFNGDELAVTVTVFAGRYDVDKTVKVDVPDAQRSGVEKGVALLKEALAG